VAGGLQAFAEVGSAAVLPDQRVVYGHAGFAVPQEGGFALVGDADGGNVFRLRVGLGHCFQGNRDLRRRNLLGIVLHPAGLGKDLIELALGDRSQFSVVIEQQSARAGCALIECQNVLQRFLREVVRAASAAKAAIKTLRLSQR
jgi:hypothetical protein